MASDIIDPFYRELDKRLNALIADRVTGLAAGSANPTQGEQATVGEKYAAQISYLKAITDILDVCHEIELDRYGPRKPEEKQGEGAVGAVRGVI